MVLPADWPPPKQRQKDMVTGMYSHDYTGSPIKGRIHVSGDRGNTWVHYDLPFAVSGNENARVINFFEERERNSESAMSTDKRSYNQSIAELQWRSFCHSFTNNRLSPKGEHAHAS